MLARKTRREHKCHTLILYGSHARGDATRASDIDLLGLISGGARTHVSRKWRGAQLDLFIYPERSLRMEPSLLRIRGGRVLYQRRGAGDRLLARVEALHKKGPKPLADYEQRAIKVWAFKMLERARRGDAEGNYRRLWLLHTLLEDYFKLRGRWYEGPKQSLAWLREHRQQDFEKFARAFKPDAPLPAIADLARLVTGRRATRKRQAA